MNMENKTSETSKSGPTDTESAKFEIDAEAELTKIVNDHFKIEFETELIRLFEIETSKMEKEFKLPDTFQRRADEMAEFIKRNPIPDHMVAKPEKNNGLNNLLKLLISAEEAQDFRTVRDLAEKIAEVASYLNAFKRS